MNTPALLETLAFATSTMRPEDRLEITVDGSRLNCHFRDLRSGVVSQHWPEPALMGALARLLMDLPNVQELVKMGVARAVPPPPPAPVPQPPAAAPEILQALAFAWLVAEAGGACRAMAGAVVNGHLHQHGRAVVILRGATAAINQAIEAAREQGSVVVAGIWREGARGPGDMPELLVWALGPLVPREERGHE